MRIAVQTKWPQANSCILKRRIIVLINVHVLGRRDGLEHLAQTGHKGSGKGEERPTERVVVLVYKVFQFPSGARRSLIVSSLTPVILFVRTKPQAKALISNGKNNNRLWERCIPQCGFSLSRRSQNRTLGCPSQPCTTKPESPTRLGPPPVAQWPPPWGPSHP
jgi:hypothetical protein